MAYNKRISHDNPPTLKQKMIEGWEQAKYTLQNTAIEVALLAVLGAGIGVYHQTRAELKRAERIPLAFSEIGAIEKTAKRHNIEVGLITEYELKVNDMCMKIFEAYNEAQHPFISKGEQELFAENIYDCMDYRYIYKYNLKDLLTQIPTYIPQVNKKLATYKVIGDDLDIANDNMNKAWDASHTDNYHTEIRTSTTIDSKGNASIHTYTVQVYDNTTHDYEYHKTYGENAAKNLTALFIKVPTIKLEEKILQTTITNAEGEYAAEKSRGITSSERLTQEQLLAIANTWRTGSTILKNIDIVEALYPKLGNSASEWNSAKNTAHDARYKTTSHYDDGPKEFQVGENTLNLGTEINANLREMQEVIKNTNIKVPLLETKIKKFIEVGYVHYASSKKEADELGDEIITLTKEIYKMNFKEGVNVDRFRLGMVFLFALIGGMIGGAVGAGLNYLDNKIGLYDRIKFK